MATVSTGVVVLMRMRRFLSSAGLSILVGQDDASNDELTFRVGQANDIWLHVSGQPGSHVVLCCADSGGKPAKSCIKEAASLAAWFSKMRDGGKVAVNWCHVKDVRKPRGARAGSVTIRNEQKVTVRPALLEEIDP